MGVPYGRTTMSVGTGRRNRCRRGSSSPASPTLSSYSSSEGTSIVTGDADDLMSLTTASDGEFPPGYYYDDDSMTSFPSEAETMTMGISELASILEADSLLLGDADKMVLQLWANSADDVGIVEDLYKPLFDCVVKNKRQHLYKVDEWSGQQQSMEVDSSTVDSNSTQMLSVPDQALSIPSLAVVVFLREEPMSGEDTWAKMKDHFDGGAWKFHHREQVSRGKLHAYENNSQDYLTARTNMPLCAMRQIHCGKRILRFLRFVSTENWRDNVNLYSLLLAKDPDILKQDFCLFTASYHADYEVQLSLKKIPRGIECRPMSGAALCFRISQVGHTVPLLPKVCTPVNDDRWQTTDLDDNVIYLDVVRLRDRSCEPVPEYSDLGVSHLLNTMNKASNSRSQSKSTKPNTKLMSYPQIQRPNSLFAYQTMQHIKECALEFSGEIKPDEKYGVSQYDSIHTPNAGECPDILAYDSLDELELLMSDIASNCSDAISHKDISNELVSGDHGRSDLADTGFFKEVSERDACGAVDGSSYHSEGNHEDNGQPVPTSPPSKSAMSKSKPAIPAKPSKLLRHANKYNDTAIAASSHPQDWTSKHGDVLQSSRQLHQNDKSDDGKLKEVPNKQYEISSSESSSCKSELSIVNQVPKRGVRSKKNSKALSPVDLVMPQSGSPVKPYQEPSYWAGLSESASSNSGGSLRSPAGGLKSPTHGLRTQGLNSHTRGVIWENKVDNNAMVVQLNHGTTKSHRVSEQQCKKSNGGQARPELPSYNELHLKSQFEQYHLQQRPHHNGSMSRQDHRETHNRGSSKASQQQGCEAYCDMESKISVSRGSLTLNEHSQGSGAAPGRDGHTMGQGLQVSSQPRGGSTVPLSPTGSNSGHSLGGSSHSPQSSGVASVAGSVYNMSSSGQSIDSSTNSIASGGGTRSGKTEGILKKPPPLPPPPPYRPPSSPAALSPRTLPTYSDAISSSKYQPTTRSVSKLDLSIRTEDSQDSLVNTKDFVLRTSKSPVQTPTRGQRFQFDGTTMPRFGRNSKLRQSVMPPPSFEEDFSDSYEEQAIDVPGALTSHNEKSRISRSAALGFYV